VNPRLISKYLARLAGGRVRTVDEPAVPDHDFVASDDDMRAPIDHYRTLGPTSRIVCAARHIGNGAGNGAEPSLPNCLFAFAKRSVQDSYVTRGLSGGAPDAPPSYHIMAHISFASMEDLQRAMDTGGEFFADIPNCTGHPAHRPDKLSP
jgi:hypothetical protein